MNSLSDANPCTVSEAFMGRKDALLLFAFEDINEPPKPWDELCDPTLTVYGVLVLPQSEKGRNFVPQNPEIHSDGNGQSCSNLTNFNQITHVTRKAKNVNWLYTSKTVTIGGTHYQ